MPREAKGRPKESSAGRFWDPWGASLRNMETGPNRRLLRLKEPAV